MNAIGKVVAGILTILVFFILPISYQGKKQDALTQVFVQSQTQRFADSIRLNGYLDAAMYQSFLSVLDGTGNLYEIRMDHAHRVTEPELDESGQVTGYYEYFESTYEAEILAVVDAEEGVYTMRQGDYISVSVSSRNDTYHDFMDRLFYAGRTQEAGIRGIAGGFILDEDVKGGGRP